VCFVCACVCVCVCMCVCVVCVFLLIRPLSQHTHTHAPFLLLPPPSCCHRLVMRHHPPPCNPLLLLSQVGADAKAVSDAYAAVEKQHGDAVAALFVTVDAEKGKAIAYAGVVSYVQV
jgi:hypothetical protein